MTVLPRILVAALIAGTAVVPAAAQYPYPYPQQPYPPGYPYPGQPYPGQPYPGTGTILDQLLRPYAVNERQAIRQCTTAAVVRARNQYRGYNYGTPNPYGGNTPYAYGQPYGAYPNVRVTAITSVERRSNGLRVRGLLDSGLYGYNPNYNQGYATGDLTFRCTVDWRGYVSDVRIRRNDNWRRY